MSKKTTLIVGGHESSDDSCLGLYLRSDRKRTKSNLPGGYAESDSYVFEESLEKLQKKLAKFLDSSEKQHSILVLGKIQSGKTAHLLGTLAWAVSERIVFSVVFTGINGDLNQQTQSRLKTSLGSLGEDFIKVFEVPTSDEGHAYQDLRTDVFALIRARLRGESALPVLVTMKNKYRISAIESLAKNVSEEFGEDVVGLYIDDEADQASQNSGAQKRTLSVTYESFTKVRKASMRNIWLSYTATPQAVLLTEKHGLIRPDLTVVASPRIGYFGLGDAVSSEYERNRVVVDDWPHGIKEVSSCPVSLKNSIHDFFFTALIRFKYQNFFYSQGSYAVTDISEKLQSVQMMIHTSNSVVSHQSSFRLVEAEVEAWKDELALYQIMKIRGEVNKDIEVEMISTINRILSRLDSEKHFVAADLVSESSITDLIDLLENCTLLIVNADPNRSNKHIPFPNSDKEWEKSKAWIVIGGDILGRGLTLPQLVTTYFMRASKTPNFDTVSQQMRFCGYRNPYRKFTSIWAPEQIFNSFFYMSQIETVVWNRALQWDRENLNIAKDMPTVMYAAPLSSRIEPTRKAVRDPELIDSKISGEVIFSSRRFMNPIFLKKNISTVNRWLSNYGESAERVNDWLFLENPPVEQVIDLISNWSTREQEEMILKGVSELYGDDMGALGLSEIPVSVFISDKVTKVDLGTPKSLEKLMNSIKFGRTVAGNSNESKLETWISAFLDDEKLGKYFDDLAITHVGGGQRKLRDHLDYEASILIIEFMNGYKTEDSKKTQVSLGLALSILSPGGYDIRVIGHAN